jgi:acetyl esterase/lipase
MTTFNLEKSAKQLTDALSKAPPLAAVPLSDARKAVAAAQSAPIPMPDIDESWVTVPSNFGQVRVRLVRPQGVASPLPVIVYLHGGGWILGSSVTHDLLTRRLAVGANAVVAFVEYSLAPEAKYPTQNEQSYAAAQWIIQQGTSGGFDTTRIAVAGDSAGGNMATVLAIMAKQRGDVRFVHQSLYYPMAKILCVLYPDPVNGYPPKYARDDIPVLEHYPDGTTLPTPAAIDFTPGQLLGCVSGELGLRPFLEGGRPHPGGHLRQGGPDSVFEKELP